MRKTISLVLAGMVVLGGLISMIGLGSTSTEEPAPTGAGADLIISTLHRVSGLETWNNITITSTGKLIVPPGTMLNVTNIYLQSGSIVEITGGMVYFSSSSHAADVRFNGTCRYFNVTNLGEIIMRGSDGYANISSPGPYTAYIPMSKGGDAILNITATEGLKMENSTVNLTGGKGFDLPASTTTSCNAWTDGAPLSGYVAAGGNATISLNLTSTSSSLIIANSTLIGIGGDGGDAADGGNGVDSNGGEGGGYTGGAGGGYNISGKPGGNVSGHVGGGGSSTLTLNSLTTIEIDNSEIITKGGNGGNAGNGGEAAGSGYTSSGGGGGGYGGGGGGSAYSAAGAGGIVSGYVGAGGNSTAYVHSINNIYIIDSNIKSISGNGGKGGNGGNSNTIYAGSGGGGYGGGGGGGYLYGDGGDGIVSDFVGSGGTAVGIIDSVNISISTTNIHIRGGSGGDAGNGGNIGGGGGGYGGGGGGSGSGGGAGNASRKVGAGGDAFFMINGSFVEVHSGFFNISGGNGGKAGNGGNGGSDGGGGGGAGYAGGGGDAVNGGSGGNGIVSGYVGTGGNSTATLTAIRLIIINLNMSSRGGNGGDGGTGGINGGSTWGTGGGGGGGYGGAGAGRGGVYSPGTCNVSGNVGDGGSSNIMISASKPTISASTDLSPSGGNGGYAPDSPGEPSGGGGAPGGPGTGRVTSNGSETERVPMSIPLLISPANGSTVYSNLSFAWIPLHNSTTNGSLINYKIEVDNNSNFSSPEIASITTVANYTPSTSLPYGTYYWRVKAYYQTPPWSSANWSETWVFTLGDLPPEIISMTPTNGSTGVGLSQPISINFSEAINITTFNFSCSPDPTGWTVAWSNNNTTATLAHNDFQYNTTYNFTVIEAKDLAGNSLKNAPVTWSFTTEIPDTSPPTSSVASISPYWHVSQIALALNASDNDGLSNVTLYYHFSSDNSSWSTWTQYGAPISISGTSWTGTMTFTFPDGDGYYQFYTIATDASNNTETKSTADAIAGYDRTSPTLTIDSPAEGSIFSTVNVSVSWSSSDSLSGIDHYEIRIGAGAWTAIGNSTSYDLTVVGDGSYTIHIRAIDRAGNKNISSVTFTVDTTAPEIRIDSPSEGSLHNATLEVTWHGSDATSGIDHYELRIDGAEWMDMGSNTTYYLEGLGDGNHTAYVKAVDKAGNEAIANVTFTVDATPPTITSHSPTGNDVPVDTTITLTFSEEMNRNSVEITIGGITGTISWNNNTATFTPPHNLSYATEYTVHVTGSDLAGNPMEEYTWSFTTTDIGTITGRITDEKGNPISGALITLDTGESTATDENGEFSIQVHAGNHNITISKDGYKTVSTSASVTAGNTTALPPIELPESKVPSEGLPWLYIFLIILIVLVIIGALLAKRRKKPEETEPAEDEKTEEIFGENEVRGH